jgi:death-on-curing protein
LTRYVRLADVLRFADVAVDGVATIRDVGLIQSALARPQASLDGVDAYPTLHLKAAALMESLIRNHGFLDGNKRTAVLSVMFFYFLNGWEPGLAEDDWFDLAMGVAAERIDLDKVAETLGASARPRSY